MARGYPEPREREIPFEWSAVLDDDLCAICKRRRAETSHGYCETCASVLSPH